MGSSAAGIEVRPSAAPSKRDGLAGDVWGGLAATLVALPASIAFGVAIYSPLGPSHAGQGALAGVLGAVAIGIVAPIFGGTERLVSAPCAPAAAVMGALAVELTSGEAAAAPERVLLTMALVGLLSAGLQVGYGLLGGGTLIKYIPYPVVTGYLSGVGVVIFLKQLPALFGLSHAAPLWTGLTSPPTWRAPALFVGACTIAAMLLAPRLTRLVPPAILGLASGIAAYLALAALDPSLRAADNALLIGPLGGSEGFSTGTIVSRVGKLADLRLADLKLAATTALTLSVLLSIDTLKTCVVVDALTRTRHDSNREVIGQGLANLASAALGGVPGAGTSGATLVNLASGARTRLSGVIEGVLVLVVYLALGPLVAWAPLAALAGILVVVAYRMFDWKSFRLLRHRATVLDFLVVASVIATAVGVGLVTASGVGIALSILLFIRDQVRGGVIHRKTYGNQVFSRQKRLSEEMAVLERRGGETVVCELTGNLFFGTTDQLFTQLQGDLGSRRFVILDLRRIRSVDLTGVRLLQQIDAQLAERGASLIYCGLPEALPSGEDLRAYFEEVGLLDAKSEGRVFPQLSDALEWVEDHILEEEGHARPREEQALPLREIDFLQGRKEETLREVLACAEERSYEPGERIFRQGDGGDEIFLVRRGRVRIALDMGRAQPYHIATVGRGDFFGDIAFLDRGTRSADAVALTRTDLLVLSRSRFDAVAERHPRLGRQFFAGLARLLAIRLRQADREIRALEEG
jgi:SulP family sulfate permease